MMWVSKMNKSVGGKGRTTNTSGRKNNFNKEKKRGFHYTRPVQQILSQYNAGECLVTYRAAGDNHIMLEYGVPETEDLNRRFRVHFLIEKLAALQQNKGNKSTTTTTASSLYCTPGVRSVLIRYDKTTTAEKVIELLKEVEKELPGKEVEVEIPSRNVYLPIAFFDSWNKAAVERYSRDFPRAKNMPYLPDNAQFVAEANGLKDKEEVAEYVTRSPYLVLGLGDVYLGAPCAYNLDPTSRLTIPKYNPARTFTPEGSVGLGGSYLCIYPMESPGGYQLIGRTIPIWNQSLSHLNWRNPWLLNYFDQINFYRVDEEELIKIREKVKEGNYEIKIEQTVFNTKKYNDDFTARLPQIQSYQHHQRQSLSIVEKRMEEESLRLKNTITEYNNQTPSTITVDEEEKEEGVLFYAPASGSITKVHVAVGDRVSLNQPLITMNAMKMEININSDVAGTVTKIRAKPGSIFNEGSVLISLAQ